MKTRGRVVGRMVVDGCAVTARVLAPGVFTLHTENAVEINGDEVPEGKGLDLSMGEDGVATLFTSRKPVIRRILEGRD